MNVISQNFKHDRRGSGLIVALVTLLVATSLMGSLLRSLLVEMRQSRHEAANLQAQWLAEAALDRAIAKLQTQPDYAGETWNVVFSPAAADSSGSQGVAEIHIMRDEPARVSVEARFPDDSRKRTKAERVWQIPNQKTKKSPASDARQEVVP